MSIGLLPYSNVGYKMGNYQETLKLRLPQPVQLIPVKEAYISFI